MLRVILLLFITGVIENCLSDVTSNEDNHRKGSARTSPCTPTPCGNNSLCVNVNGLAGCSCAAGYIGSPPHCRYPYTWSKLKADCSSNSDCSITLACIQGKCTNPCIGNCGTNAECTVENHTALCICPSGYTGDPYIQCTSID